MVTTFYSTNPVGLLSSSAVMVPSQPRLCWCRTVRNLSHLRIYCQFQTLVSLDYGIPSTFPITGFPLFHWPLVVSPHWNADILGHLLQLVQAQLKLFLHSNNCSIRCVLWPVRKVLVLKKNPVFPR